MSQQTKLNISISRTLTVMAKTVNQLRSGACAIKKRQPAVCQTNSVWQFLGRRISLFRHLSHLGSIRQQLEHRKIAQFRIVDVPERLEAPNDGVDENRGTSTYIAAFAWPVG